MKRLPIFERLIPDDDCVATVIALGTPAGDSSIVCEVHDPLHA